MVEHRGLQDRRLTADDIAFDDLEHHKLRAADRRHERSERAACRRGIDKPGGLEERVDGEPCRFGERVADEQRGGGHEWRVRRGVRNLKVGVLCLDDAGPRDGEQWRLLRGPQPQQRLEVGVGVAFSGRRHRRGLP